MKRAETSLQGVSKDPPLSRWEVVVVWVAASTVTFGWLPIYALVCVVLRRILVAVDVLLARAHEIRVQRSCSKGERWRAGD